MCMCTHTHIHHCLGPTLSLASHTHTHTPLPLACCTRSLKRDQIYVLLFRAVNLRNIHTTTALTLYTSHASHIFKYFIFIFSHVSFREIWWFYLRYQEYYVCEWYHGYNTYMVLIAPPHSEIRWWNKNPIPNNLQIFNMHNNYVRFDDFYVWSDDFYVPWWREDHYIRNIHHISHDNSQISRVRDSVIFSIFFNILSILINMSSSVALFQYEYHYISGAMKTHGFQNFKDTRRCIIHACMHRFTCGCVCVYIYIYIYIYI